MNDIYTYLEEGFPPDHTITLRATNVEDAMAEAEDILCQSECQDGDCIGATVFKNNKYYDVVSFCKH